MATDELREYFRSLASEQDIRELIGTTENIHLEFKRKGDNLVPDLQRGDAINFARALSGFANSDGGLLIWGISDKGGKAESLLPIIRADDFATRLERSVLNSTIPVVDGVEIITLPSGVANSGYVKCLIPASDKAPHRCNVGEREYHKRTATNFYALEHFDLEDMFGRRPHPSLNVHLELRPTGDSNRVHLHFGLVNVGRGLAKHAGFICRFGQGVRVQRCHGGITDQTEANSQLPTITYQENKLVFPPETAMVTFVGWADLAINRGEAVPIDLTVYCEGMATRKVAAKIKEKVPFVA